MKINFYGFDSAATPHNESKLTNKQSKPRVSLRITLSNHSIPDCKCLLFQDLFRASQQGVSSFVTVLEYYNTGFPILKFSKRFVSQCYPKVSPNSIKVIETDEGVLELDILDVGSLGK